MGVHRLRTLGIAGLVLVPALVLKVGVASNTGSGIARPPWAFTHLLQPSTSAAPR